MNNFKDTGRVVSGIELRQSPEGDYYAHFELLIGEDGNTSKIPCIAFNVRAELLSTYAIRGDEVEITGELTQCKYQTSFGEDKCELAVRVTEVSFINLPLSA